MLSAPVHEPPAEITGSHHEEETAGVINEKDDAKNNLASIPQRAFEERRPESTSRSCVPRPAIDQSRSERAQEQTIWHILRNIVLRVGDLYCCS